MRVEKVPSLGGAAETGKDAQRIHGKVHALRWDSQVTVPGRGVGTLAGEFLPFRIPPILIGPALHAVPERLFLRLAAKAGGDHELSSLFKAAYRGMRGSDAFGLLRPAMPICLSGRPRRKGHAFVYLPEHVDSSTPVLVCLHGFGGNFLFYLWALLPALTDCVIACPSWCVNSAPDDAPDLHKYIQECVARVAARCGVGGLSTPLLMAVSNGGTAGPLVIDRNPRAYRGYVSASSSITDDLRNVGRYPILMLHGERDPGFALPDFKRSKDWLVRKGAKVEATTWDASHWLILSHREEVSHRIRAFAGM